MSSVQNLDTALLRVTDLNYSVAGRELLIRIPINFGIKATSGKGCTGREGLAASQAKRIAVRELH